MFLTERITKENISEVSHLLRPFHQSKLSQGLNQSICYALYCVDTPVGLVYGEVDEGPNQFVIKQLSLADKFKGRKLEELLLNEIELSVAERNESEIVFSLRVKEGESSDYIVNILRENGWQDPYFVGYLFFINNEVLHWKWLNLPLAKGMKTYKWNQLPGKLIDKFVIDQKTDRLFPDYIPEYLSKNKFSYERSAALVTGNNIIGLMFVEISETGLYIYPYAHLLEEYQRIGKSVPFISLFKETVSGKKHLQDLEFIFSVNADNHNMHYFLKRQWRPYTRSLYREYNSKKKLEL